jgi:phospholipid transport system substrate-binding protein
MNRKTNTIVFSLTASLLLVPALPALDQRAAMDQSPVEVIRARNRAVTQILDRSGDEPNEQTREQLKDVINSVMDFRELSRRALGKHWNGRTEQEKAEFVDVFEQLIRNSSVKKLSIYRADSVTYDEPTITGDDARVRTAAYKDRKSVEIVYEMHTVDGEWKAYDLVIDGASTVRTYRDSFYRQLAKSSYPEMYAKLVRKLNEEQ